MGNPAISPRFFFVLKTATIVLTLTTVQASLFVPNALPLVATSCSTCFGAIHHMLVWTLGGAL